MWKYSPGPLENLYCRICEGCYIFFECFSEMENGDHHGRRTCCAVQETPAKSFVLSFLLSSQNQSKKVKIGLKRSNFVKNGQNMLKMSKLVGKDKNCLVQKIQNQQKRSKKIKISRKTSVERDQNRSEKVKIGQKGQNWSKRSKSVRKGWNWSEKVETVWSKNIKNDWKRSKLVKKGRIRSKKVETGRSLLFRVRKFNFQKFRFARFDFLNPTSEFLDQKSASRDKLPLENL